MTTHALLRFATVALDHTVVEVARRLEPSRLRSLDAIHIASALSLGIEDLAFVAYHQLCLEGAARLGLAPSSPRASAIHPVRPPYQASDLELNDSAIRVVTDLIDDALCGLRKKMSSWHVRSLVSSEDQLRRHGMSARLLLNAAARSLGPRLR